MKKICLFAVAVSLAASAGCSDNGTQTDAGPQGTAGATTAGGTTGGTSAVPSTGGTVTVTGGNTNAGGQTAVGGAGGNTTPGGTTAASSATPTGGTTPTGGSTTASTPTGGKPPIDSSTPTGGKPPTGGSTPTGGETPTGGATLTGGSTPMGGSPPKGGSTESGSSGNRDAGPDSNRDVGSTGGTGGSTGTGGAAGGGGSTQPPSTGPCSALPVSPNPTAQAKNLLCFIYSQYGNHVISGQQETSWADPEGDISWYATNNLKSPAILGGDFLYPSGGSDTSTISGITRAIAYWNAGGISMFRYHQGVPVAGSTYKNDCYQGTNCAESTPASGLLTAAVTAGTPENTAFLNRLNYVGFQIKAMQTANVPIILAIFHETQPNGWFWWSKGTAAELVALWKYTFNYLTVTKDLHNIIWLMPFSGLNGMKSTQFSAYFPGKDTVDLSGPDYSSDANTFSQVKTVVGNTMPIPLHESSKFPDPSTLFPSSAPFVLFNTWAGSQKNNTSIPTAFNSSFTVTRDKVPNLK